MKKIIFLILVLPLFVFGQSNTWSSTFTPTTYNQDFLLKVAKGEVPGHSIVDKFGQNDGLNTSTYEDIWDVGGDYPYPTSATITEIVSTATDSVDIEVQGLSSDGTLTVQTVTLTGITPVALTTPLWRVFRLKNVGVADLVGNASVENTANDTVFAKIIDGNNQTLMALYTIPKGETGYLVQGTATMAGTKNAYVIAGKFATRNYGGVFQLKRTFGVHSTGTSSIVFNFPLYSKILALTDIKVGGISTLTDGVLNATFQILIIDDGY